jgi:hypothetical protein
MFDHGRSLSHSGGVHTLDIVLGERPGCSVYLSGGASMLIRPNSINLGGFFEKIVDGSWVVHLVLSEIWFDLLPFYDGRDHNHGDRINPNLIP